jgi:solute carrier family 25 protein 46
MSDKPYPRNMSRGDDFDLWQMSFANINNQSSSQRRVEFDLNESIKDQKSSNNSLGPNIQSDNSLDSEPVLKTAIAITSTINLLTDHLISHPFIVIRRQTQVNRKSGLYHLTPITIIPFMIRIQRKQGFSVLWKGIGSVFITKGMLIAFEAIIAELTPFPKDISSKRLTADKVVQHLVLKGMAFLLITPFLCSSCVETVQSSIASENPGVFDCLKEGFSRISHWKMGRKLPIWLLCGPTVTYNLSHYLIYTLVRNFSLYINQQNSTTNGTESNNWKNQYKEIISSFWGHLIADIVLFPLQTIILRYESFCLK